MLSINEILESVKGLLAERLPDIPLERFYTNRTPVDFERPAALITFGRITMEDASCACVEVTLPVVIDLFVAVDEYHNSHIEELARRMLAVQELFAAGALLVGDRALHVVFNEGNCNFDYAEITVTLRYQDDRPGGEDYPLIASVRTTIITNKEG